jgi:hypothetical protein
VIVKTHKFKTIGAIPDGLDMEDSVQVLVINRIDSLGQEERELVLENSPGVNLDKVWIVEEGRRPASLAKSGGMTFGGVLLAAPGVDWMFSGRRRE